MKTGAVVSVVRPNSPAQAAGVQPSDVIIEFNRKRVANVRELTRAVAETPVGSTVPMVVIRSGKRVTLQVKLDRRETRILASAAGSLPAGALQGAGLTLQKPSREVTEAFGLPAGIEGVVVTAVDPDSPAAIVLQPQHAS